MLISLIAAMAANRCIGRGGQIPWHLPGDLQRFKQLTMGQSLLMGRKTFESIGHPLPGRQMIVLSRDPAYRAEGCDLVPSLQAGLDVVSRDQLFICGGEELYRQTLPLCQRIYLTQLEREVDGDRFLPEISEGEFFPVRHLRLIEQETYSFSILVRKGIPARETLEGR